MSLVEDNELKSLGSRSRRPSSSASDCSVSLPNRRPTARLDSAQQAVNVTIALLNAGQRVVFHCRGGLGRAGTLAACTLVKLGEHPTAAIELTRQHRPGHRK